MSRISYTVSRAVAAAVLLASASGQAADVTASDAEAAYAQEIVKRVDKVLAPLGIADEAQMNRVRDLITSQYRTLRELHSVRDARINEAKRSPGDAAIAEAWTKTARDTASLKLAEAHRRFVVRLAVELTPEQVDKVKDGMTYGVVGITYKRYLELFPNLRDEDKRELQANLIEARELAMDAGSSEEKHAVFGKYKGRINNYLSKAGYDMKQAEKDLAEKQKAAPQAR